MTERPGIARVLPETRVPQLDRVFDYRIPPGLTVTPGTRVKVPLGRGGRTATGFVIETASSSEFTGRLADIEQVVSDVVVVPPPLFALAKQVAERHAGGLSDVLRLAVPARAVKVEKNWIGSAPLEAALPAAPEPSPWYSHESWEALQADGSRISWRLPHGVGSEEPVVPLAHQEVSRYASTILSQGHSVVVVVPDWRDTELVHRSLSHLLPEVFIARLEGNQPAGERYRNYLRCLQPEPVVVIGSRHAIYAPVSDLGAVVVMHDDDDSHREPLAPYPHTRDIALIRAEQTGARVVFASLAPSIHTVRLHTMGFLSEVSPRSITRARVIPTTLTTSEQPGSLQARLPSMAFQAAKKALESGPVLIQVFHSGYAPGMACAACGERARCGRCQGPLRTTSTTKALTCGWCGHIESPWRCGECGGTVIKPLGQAVGRTITELGKAFPGVKVVQADGSHPHLTVPRTPALVVSTRGAEPVVAGGYPVALLLDGQSMLQRESLNAMTDTIHGWERALALLSADATAYLTDLDGPIAQGFSSGALVAMMKRELAERQQLHLPPAVRLAVVDGPRAVVEHTLSKVESAVGALETIGPIPLSAGAVRVVVKVPYGLAPTVAQELRAAVVLQAAKAPRYGTRLKVSMDGQHALDQLLVDAQ